MPAMLSQNTENVFSQTLLFNPANLLEFLLYARLRGVHAVLQILGLGPKKKVGAMFGPFAHFGSDADAIPTNLLHEQLRELVVCQQPALPVCHTL